MTSIRMRFHLLLAMIFVVAAAFCFPVPNLFAQELRSAPPSDDRSSGASLLTSDPSDKNLPDAPQPQKDEQDSHGPAPLAAGSASISGIVQDVTGATVSGARVTLRDGEGAPRLAVISGLTGEFTFSGVPAGSYVVIVNAKDLQPFQSAPITLQERQAYVVPEILLRVAMASSEVTVRPTEEVAAEQMKAEEKQRIFGIVPNFYTSYVYNAAPLNAKQKYSLAFHDVFDPTSFVGAGISAGIGQATNRFGAYGHGPGGYGKRYAAALGDGLTSDLLSHAVFPSIFHQDPRYFYQGTGSTKSRLVHALSFSVLLRGDTGRPVPNYSFLLGDIGSGLISNLYYPKADRGVGLVFTNAAVGIAGRAGGTVFREFFLKRITKNVPTDSKP